MSQNYRMKLLENLKNENKNLNSLCENKERIDYFFEELINYFNCNSYNKINSMHNHKIATLFNDLFLNDYVFTTQMLKFGREYKWTKHSVSDDTTNVNDIVITSKDIRIFVQHFLYTECINRLSLILNEIENKDNNNKIVTIKNKANVLADFLPLFSDGSIYFRIIEASLTLNN